ncbi:extracellular ligand-gated ion channel [Aureococcus anophagefferens]|nr:extracellular ligand-gated ion channel [Aureococcus anophagefferens]
MAARGDGLERFLPAAADAQKTTSQLALPDGEFGGALRSSLSALYEDRGGAELELTVEGRAGKGDLAGLVEKLKIADEFGLARLRQRCASALAAKFDELFRRAADGDSGKRSSPLLLELAPDMVGEVLCKSRLAVVDEADVLDRAGQESEIPNFKGSSLGRDKLLELRADAELMAVDGAVALVMRALEILAFPQSAKPVSAKEEETADPSTLQTLARTGLCCFDGTFSSSLATIGRRALSIPWGPTCSSP